MKWITPSNGAGRGLLQVENLPTWLLVDEAIEGGGHGRIRTCTPFGTAV